MFRYHGRVPEKLVEHDQRENAIYADGALTTSLKQARDEVDRIRGDISFQENGLRAVPTAQDEPLPERSSATATKTTPLQRLRKKEAALVAKIASLEEQQQDIYDHHRAQSIEQGVTDAMDQVRAEFEAAEAEAKERRFEQYLQRRRQS